MMTDMDKTRLAAFVDGALSPEDAAAVVLHLADHLADQAYADDLFAANLALQQAFSAPLHEPVPEAIRQAIMGPAETATVVAFRPRPRWALGGLAIAASVALAVAVLPALVGAPLAGYALGLLPKSDPMIAVLDARASGDALALPDGREAMVLATFEMPDGRYCREFEMIDRTAGRIDFALGCRTTAGWNVEAVVAEVMIGADQGFVPAEGAEIDTLTRYLERLGATTALDPEAEAALIAQAWRR